MRTTAKIGGNGQYVRLFEGTPGARGRDRRHHRQLSVSPGPARYAARCRRRIARRPARRLQSRRRRSGCSRAAVRAPRTRAAALAKGRRATRSAPCSMNCQGSATCRTSATRARSPCKRRPQPAQHRRGAESGRHRRRRYRRRTGGGRYRRRAALAAQAAALRPAARRRTRKGASGPFPAGAGFCLVRDPEVAAFGPGMIVEVVGLLC